MKCSECKHLKVSDYIFPDETKSIECDKYSKLLGFTTTSGLVVEEFLKGINCDKKQSDENKVLEFTKKDSGVKGITWSYRFKTWQVRVYSKKTKKQRYIGARADLDKAKKIFEDWVNENKYRDNV